MGAALAVSCPSQQQPFPAGITNTSATAERSLQRLGRSIANHL